MPKLSAGIMLYRLNLGRVEVLLVHPGGPFWAKKDAGAWSIPKGEYTKDEDAFAAAKREYAEELGSQTPDGAYIELGDVRYSNKHLLAWAVQGDMDTKTVTSNSFELEWPPKSGQKQSFPEVDKAAWFDGATAKHKLVPGQVPLLLTLLQQLAAAESDSTEQQPPKQLPLL